MCNIYFCEINWDLSRTLLARTKAIKILRSFFKSDRGYGAGSPVFGVSFVSFSLRLCRQRKAAKNFWYQRSFNAFSFEKRGPKEKALQKEKGRIRGAARSTPRHLLKKVDENFFIAQSRC